MFTDSILDGWVLFGRLLPLFMVGLARVAWFKGRLSSEKKRKKEEEKERNETISQDHSPKASSFGLICKGFQVIIFKKKKKILKEEIAQSNNSYWGLKKFFFWGGEY